MNQLLIKFQVLTQNNAHFVLEKVNQEDLKHTHYYKEWIFVLKYILQYVKLRHFYLHTTSLS